jgi:hypothetical protein
MAKKKNKRNKRGDQYRLVTGFLDELEWSTTKKYVELLRERGDLLELGPVDVDVPQIVKRHFICDSKRCVEWSGETPLIDRGCCCRYEVPLTARDREAILRRMDEIRPNLPDGHRLLDPDADPFKMDDDFGFAMVHDNPMGGCQFNQYIDGQCRCVLHLTALQNGDNPQDYKPVACSLWPLAINAYDDDGDERILLTVYCEDNTELFDEAEDDPFACIIDQSPSYPRAYQSERPTLEYLFGADWWRELDAKAKKILGSKRHR